MKRRNLLMLLLLSVALSSAAQTTDEGIKAMDYENYATARRIFSKLVKAQPTVSINYYYLGVIYCDLEKIDSARAIFNAGIAADPKSIYNYVGLGRTYLEQNNIQQATQNFDKAKSLTTQKDILQYKLIADAWSSAAHPNYDMAVSLLKKAIEYTNKDAEVYWILGKTYDAMNKSGEAVSSYERSTELNPTYAKSFTRIGVIWRNARRLDLSQESFDKALKADPKFPPAFRELAEMYFYTGKYDLATQTYQKYLDLADKDDETQFRYGKFLFVTKKYREAIQIFEGLRSKIESPVLYRLLGYCYYEVGEYEKGLKDLNTFFEKSDSAKLIASDYEYLGKLQIKTGNEAQGLLTMEKAIHVDSTKYDLYDTIATYYFKQKQYAKAAEYYDKKLKRMPPTSIKEILGTDYQEGKALYFANDYIKSDSVFMVIGKLSPNWPISYLFRARTMLHIDSLDTARGKAFPFYNLFVSKAYNDTAKYKRELTEAYQYLGNYNTFYTNYGVALYYFEKALALDPRNEEIKTTLKSVKDTYKTQPGNAIPVTKDSTGVLVSAIVNGHQMNCLYDPGLIGIGANSEGSIQIFGAGTDGEAAKGVIVKISEHSVKNVPVIIIADQKQPVAIGADVLNKMNMVFDYASSSLLQR